MAGLKDDEGIYAGFSPTDFLFNTLPFIAGKTDYSGQYAGFSPTIFINDKARDVSVFVIRRLNAKIIR